MATSLRDCELLLQIICDSNPAALDPDVFPQTWQQQTALAGYDSPSNRSPLLRVGIIRTDGHVTPLPPIQGFMDEVAQTLSSRPLEVEVVNVDIAALGPQFLKAFNGVISVDGANHWFDLLEQTGEPLSPWMESRLRRRPRKQVVSQIIDRNLAVIQSCGFIPCCPYLNCMLTFDQPLIGGSPRDSCSED